MARNVPFENGYFYHVMNRGVEKRETFLDASDYKRFLLGMSFYRYINPPAKLSVYLDAPPLVQQVYIETLKSIEKKHIEILCYCCMPNHFHMLLKQSEENGISKYMHLLLDSYTKYFNKRYKRVGSLFQGTFKAVAIESDEELLHVSRYIHLNPTTASLEETELYAWSSMKDYLNPKPGFIQTEIVLHHFSDNPAQYKDFVSEQRAYQKSLAVLRNDHLAID